MKFTQEISNLQEKVIELEKVVEQKKIVQEQKNEMKTIGIQKEDSEFEILLK